MTHLNLYSTSAPTLNVGSLIEGKYYKIEIFLMEPTGNDYLRIKWKINGDSSFITQATTELSNLLPS